MNFLSPEYNMQPTAGSCLGRKHSEETKAKISAAHMGKIGWSRGLKLGPLPEQWRINIGASRKGKPRNWKTRQ